MAVGERFRGSGPATLVGAGVLLVAAAVADGAAQLGRWAPCLSGFATDGCGARQDHRFDYFLPWVPALPADVAPGYTPAAPWVQVGGGATLTGIAFLLVVAAMLLTIRALGPVRSPDPRGVLAAVGAYLGWLLLAGLVLAVGLVNLASGAAGVALDEALTARAFWTWAPLLGLGLAAWLITRPHADLVTRLVAVAVAAVSMRGNLPEYFVAMMTWDSHDTPPFDGATTIAVIGLMGVALLVVGGRRLSRPPRLVVIAGLITAAGLLEIAAQLRRWTPCFAGFDTPACMQLQDHAHDSFLPSPPWTDVTTALPWLPIPGAAAPTGVAFLLLALALVLSSRVLGPARTRADRVAVAAWSVFAVLVATAGTATAVSGFTGATLAATPAVQTVWFLLAPLLGVGLAIRTVAGGPAEPVAWVVAGVLTVLAFRGSLAEYLVPLTGYASHDTSPFTGWMAAVLFTLLGPALIVAAALPNRRREPVAG